jgi:hypothetical protein
MCITRCKRTADEALLDSQAHPVALIEEDIADHVDQQPQGSPDILPLTNFISTLQMLHDKSLSADAEQKGFSAFGCLKEVRERAAMWQQLQKMQVQTSELVKWINKQVTLGLETYHYYYHYYPYNYY